MLRRIKDHPDIDEIVSKLSTEVSPKDVAAWLSNRYENKGDLCISEDSLSTFKNIYLDFFAIVQEDKKKVKEEEDKRIEKALKSKSSDDLEEALDTIVKKNRTYKDVVLNTIKEEYNIKKQIVVSLKIIESRIEAIYDKIINNEEISVAQERLLLDFMDRMGTYIDRYSKIIDNKPDITVQNNVSIEILSKHVTVFQEIIKDTIASFDVGTAMEIAKRLNENISRMKPLMDTNNQELIVEEAKILSEQVQTRLAD